jgi:putative transposase
MIDKGEELPITRQCALLDLCRSGVYCQAVPVSTKDFELMQQIDESHLTWPFYGSRNIRNELWDRGYDVGRDRVRRLMRIEALYAKPKLSPAHPGHKKYITLRSTTRSGGIKALTGKPGLWSTSAQTRRDRLRHEPGAVYHL